jgi:uncharacterized protein
MNLKGIKYLLVALLLLVTVASISGALDLPARPASHVVDLAGLMDGTTENKLAGYLRELEQKTTAQIVVLTIKSLEGESLEDVSLSVAHEKWKIGQKGKDNGILFLVAVKERKYRIEVGYGLEGVVPDSLAGSIGRDYLVPFFKKGEYSKGIYVSTLALANEVAKDASVTITGMPGLRRQATRTDSKQSVGPMGLVLKGIFFLVMLILFIRNPRLFLMLFLLSSMGGRRQSSIGGGFGGFSGGGGGFGGGGASGGW